MSALIFYTDSDQILVVTDTLAANADGSPHLFTSKAHYLPHLQTIVAGTGIGGFSVEWFLHANSRMVLRGIENLDFHTPAALNNQWKRYKADYSGVEHMTTTVYHFGISEDTGNVVAFAYRSEREFVSERLQYGIGVKPECAVPEGNLFEHLPSMMNEQRAIQATKPLNERIFIGGEAIAMHLTKEGCKISKIFDFSDRENNEKEIFNSYAKSAF